MKKSKRGGKSVEMTIKFWWNPRDRSIHIRGGGRPALLISTVNANPASKRGNPNLFGKLARCLKQAGAPAPE
jgi:hypothetical protein